MPSLISRFVVTQPKRVPSLDGLRGVSILLVLIGHLGGSAGFLPTIPPGQDLGSLGVRVFFVISGYIITYLLLKEKSESGVISLKRFYARRVFRIFPPFYAYIAFVAALGALGLIRLQRWEMLYAVTFTSNLYHVRSWYTGHLWSLSVEEQFYVLWPSILRFAGSKRAIIVACCVFFAAPLFRLSVLFLLPGQTFNTLELFPTVADSLAIGCLLAGARELLGCTPLYLKILASPWFPTMIPIIFLLNHQFSTKLYYGVESTILNIAIALALDSSIRFPLKWTGRVLNSRPLTTLGVLSYSLYIWQQPFLNRNTPSLVTHFPLSLGCATSLALTSYFVIEKPFQRFRANLSRLPFIVPAKPEAEHA